MFGLPIAWLLIVPVLAFLVFVHELGHFVTAKRFGITVTEFGFGFPPRIFGVRYRGTLYSINWIPLGGFVRLVGEEDPTEPGSFARQPAWKRAVVLVAGSFMNLLLPVFIFSTILMLPHDAFVGTVVIAYVTPNSPAERAGLRSGDAILAVDGHHVDNHADLLQKILARLGKSTELTVRRASIITGMSVSPEFVSVGTVTVVPRLNPPIHEVVEEVIDPENEISLTDARRLNRDTKLGDKFAQGYIGIGIGTANVKIVKRTFPIWEAVPMSFGRIRDVIVISKNGLARWIVGGPDPGLVGPIGIAQVTGEVAKAGVAPVFELIALISISLGVVNLLPIPALDGGKLLFVGVELARRGKRISPEREGLVHLVGFAVLIVLILFIGYFDITRLLNGESFLR